MQDGLLCHVFCCHSVPTCRDLPITCCPSSDPALVSAGYTVTAGAYSQVPVLWEKACLTDSLSIKTYDDLNLHLSRNNIKAAVHTIGGNIQNEARAADAGRQSKMTYDDFLQVVIL